MIIREKIVPAKNIIIDIASNQKYIQVKMKREKVGGYESFRGNY